MSDTSVLKKGVAIKFENKNWFVQDTFFVSPGKGSAFFRTKLREIETGKVVEHTFKSGEGIELLDTERRNATYLYTKNGLYVFMDDESFEQYEYDDKIVVESTSKFLKENQTVIILFAEDNPLTISFPKTKVVFKVTEAPPAIKGDTVSSSYRPIKIETGATIQAPMFIKENDEIVVNVETGEYSERAKK